MKNVGQNLFESLTGAVLRASDDALWLQSPTEVRPKDNHRPARADVNLSISSESSFSLNSENGANHQGEKHKLMEGSESESSERMAYVLSEHNVRVIPGRVPLLQRHTHRLKMKDGSISTFPVILIGRAFHGRIFAASVGEELTEKGIRMYMGTLACSPETQPAFLTLKHWATELCKQLSFHSVWSMSTPLPLLIERQCYNAVTCLMESGIVRELCGRKPSFIEKIAALFGSERKHWKPSTESIREQLVRVCCSYVFERLHDELMRQVNRRYEDEIASLENKLKRMAKTVSQEGLGVDPKVGGDFSSVKEPLKRVHGAKTPLAKLQCFNEARQQMSECCYYNAMGNNCNMSSFAVGSDHMINPLVYILIKHHSEIRTSELLAQLIFIADFHTFAERTLEKAFMDIQGAIVYLIDKASSFSEPT